MKYPDIGVYFVFEKDWVERKENTDTKFVFIYHFRGTFVFDNGLAYTENSRRAAICRLLHQIPVVHTSGFHRTR